MRGKLLAQVGGLVLLVGGTCMGQAGPPPRAEI